MINKLKTTTGKKLLTNFFSLSSLQLVNLLLPLLTIPYLIRVLGIELFGLLAFASATIMYFQVFSEYGFNLTATKEVSIHRNNKIKLDEIVSTVLIIKFILSLICFFILNILIVLFEKFSNNYEIFYLTFLMIFGQIMFPIWFFQGIEDMKYITFLNVIAKGLFTILIFIFVNSPQDTYLVPLFQSTGYLLIGFYSIYFLKRKFKINFMIPKLETIKSYLIDGWHIFISRISVLLYTSSNIFILGLFTNNTIVGYYAIAEKIISASTILGSIVNQVLYPHLSKIWGTNNIQKYYNQLKVNFLLVFIPMLIMVILIFIFSKEIIIMVTGNDIQVSQELLELLLFAAILIPLGGLFTQNLVIQYKNSYVTRITMFTTLLNMLLVFILIRLFGVYGLAYTVIAVQVFQVIYNTSVFLKLKGNL